MPYPTAAITLSASMHFHPCKRVVVCCAALMLAWALAGCATFRDVDSTVQSYSTITTLPVPATFRIEPLPSQQQDATFVAIARMTCTALQHVGLQRDDAQATLVITIRTQASYATPGWPHDPWFIWGSGRYGSRHGGITARAMLRDAPPSMYRRSLQLLMRDTRTQQVVYETSALHEDVWTQDPEIYGVLAQAALQGFPHPPTGTRHVVLPFGSAKNGIAPIGAAAVVTPAKAAPAPPQPPTPPLAGHAAAGC